MSPIRFDIATGDVVIDHGHRIGHDIGLAAMWLRWHAGTDESSRVAESLVLENYTRGRDDKIPSAWGDR